MLERGGINHYLFCCNLPTGPVDVLGLYTLYFPWYWSSSTVAQYLQTFGQLQASMGNILSFLDDALAKAQALPDACPYKQALLQQLTYAKATMQSVKSGLASTDDLYVGYQSSGGWSNPWYPGGTIPFLPAPVVGPYIQFNGQDASSLLHELTHVHGADDTGNSDWSLYNAYSLETLLDNPSGALKRAVDQLKAKLGDKCCEFK